MERVDDERSLFPDGGRRSAMGTRWAVTSPHAAASYAGAAQLAAGGTAADAAIATAAALSVVYPHMTGIGGDMFALYYSAADGVVTAYNGSGPAAALATPEYYGRSGHTSIPERGALSALTVPGAVDGWFALHERFGSREMAQLLASAIALAREGVPIVRSVARSLVEERAVLDADEGGRAAFGSGRAEGKLVQPALARTLERIATHGRAWLYEGEGAAAIDAYCARAGSPLRAADFHGYRGDWATPLRAPFRGFESLTTPPNSQGLALLLAQQYYGAYMGDDRPADDSAALVHATVETAKLAYAQRDRYVTDPARMPVLLEELFAANNVRAAAGSIDPNAASRLDAVLETSGTTYFACVDERGNAASVIQSLYAHFGSGVVVPDLGVALHNRGCWCTLDAGAPRSLEPGKRPFHTLIANMLLHGGHPALVYGSMGGDAQPQIGLSLSIRIAERGLRPQAAIARPRWRWIGATGNAEPDLLIEGRAGAACVAGLRARGHRVQRCDDWDERMGHAGAIEIDRATGTLLAGCDPRSDGLALCG